MRNRDLIINFKIPTPETVLFAGSFLPPEHDGDAASSIFCGSVGGVLLKIAENGEDSVAPADFGYLGRSVSYGVYSLNTN